MAEVLAIGIECDLALLTVKNETFWEGAKLLKLGALPRLKVTKNMSCPSGLGDPYIFPYMPSGPLLQYAGHNCTLGWQAFLRESFP